MDHPAWKLHSDLWAALRLVYAPLGLECVNPAIEQESTEYGACQLEMSGLALRLRVSKITPRKAGQFVTLWKRVGNGPIQPFDASDPIDFFVICCRRDQQFGQFVFPTSVLCEKGIVSCNGKDGKRAMRIYPPWDRPINRQALHTQNWQLDYFLEVAENKPLDEARARKLYGLKP